MSFIELSNSDSVFQGDDSNTHHAIASDHLLGPSLTPRIPERSVPPSVLPEPPTARDWEAYRPLITTLYRVEGRKLKDVKHVLEQEHGFAASERMFKKRIDDWKIHKNYKRADKMLLLNRLKNLPDSSISALEFGDRPAKIHRLVRFCKENGLKDEELILDSFKGSTATPEGKEQGRQVIRHEQRRAPRSPPWLLCPSPPLIARGEMRNAEIILLQIGHYYESYSNLDVGRFQFLREVWEIPMSRAERWHKLFQHYQAAGFTSTALWNSIDSAQRLLHLGQTQLGFSEFNHACSKVRGLLLLEDPLLIPHVVSMFANKLDHWSNMERRNRFHDFVVAMAAVTLGDSHPITVIITLLKSLPQSDLFTLSWQRVLDLVPATVQQSKLPKFCIMLAIRDIHGHYRHMSSQCGIMFREKRSILL